MNSLWITLSKLKALPASDAAHIDGLLAPDLSIPDLYIRGCSTLTLLLGVPIKPPSRTSIMLKTLY